MARLEFVFRRSVVLTKWISLGGSVTFLLISFWVGLTTGKFETVWAYALGSLLLAATWIFAQRLVRDTTDALTTKDAEVGVLRDRLESQRESVDELADGLDVAVFVADGKGSVLYANRRAREFFRFDDPLGRSLLAVTLSYDLEQLVVRAASTGEPALAEVSFSYPAERIGIAKAWLSAGTVGRVFLSIYDVSDLRRLERVRKDFVANVSHELRTPMTLIRAMAETLLDEANPEDEMSQRYLSSTSRVMDER